MALVVENPISWNPWVLKDVDEEPINIFLRLWDGKVCETCTTKDWQLASFTMTCL